LSYIKNKSIIFQIKNHIATITLNRPSSLNALNDDTHLQLRSIWDHVEDNKDIRVVVLQGSGDRAFCVGQDLKELHTKGATDSESTSVTFSSSSKPGTPRITDRYDITKPIIASVNGYALGGGFELVLASDIVVATANSTFGLPEVKHGLVPAGGGVFRLGRQIPPKIAMELLLTGKSISAERALELGLVNKVVDRGELKKTTYSIAAEIANAAPLAVRAIKEAFYLSDGLSISDAFQADYPMEKIRRNSFDAYEGVRAFKEKRAPIWTGQ
jgi:hypothetical protein